MQLPYPRVWHSLDAHAIVWLLTVVLLVDLQANSELQCVTNATSGTINVHTPAGIGSIGYSASSLSVSAIVTGVVPSVWSTSTTTAITITGSRFGTSLPAGRALIPFCLTSSLISSLCTGVEVICHLNGSTSAGALFSGEWSETVELRFTA